MDKNNTHYYDEKIDITLIPNTPKATIDNLIFSQTRQKIKNVKYYDLMLNNDPANYDPINKLHALDLLYIVCEISLKNPEILELLEEQLNDMTTGFCPQGRTIRLYQIILPFL